MKQDVYKSEISRLRAKVESLECELIILKAQIGDGLTEGRLLNIANLYGLTRRQSQIMLMLVDARTVSLENLYDTIYPFDDGPDINVIRVLMSQLRARLRKHHIIIGVRYRIGYYLDDSIRKIIKGLL